MTNQKTEKRGSSSCTTLLKKEKESQGERIIEIKNFESLPCCSIGASVIADAAVAVIFVAAGVVTSPGHMSKTQQTVQLKKTCCDMI